MQGKYLLFLFILIITPLSFTDASQNIIIDTKPKKVGINSTNTHYFNITNTDNPIYIIRIEMPTSSNIKFTELLDCPEDKNFNDQYSWAKSIDSNQITCQTSARVDNPNLITSGKSTIITARATSPNLNIDSTYNWRIITENISDFSQTLNTSAQIFIDATPPKLSQIQLNDNNNNNMVDSLVLKFDDEIDHNAHSATDFKIDNVTIEKIIPTNNNSFELILSDEIVNTNKPIITYNPNSENFYSQALVGFSNFESIKITDKIGPIIIFSNFNNNPPKIGENRLSIIFSETLDNNSPLSVSIKGLKDTYQITQTEFINDKWKGVLNLIVSDTVDINKLIITGARDLNGNQLVNSPNSLYTVSVEPTVISQTSNSQIEQIKEDAINIINNNVTSWKSNNNSNKITEIFTNYTKSLLSGINSPGNIAMNNLSHFILYGTTSTIKLGAGERAGVLSSYKSAFNKLPILSAEWEDVLKIANGRWPSNTSTPAEDRAKISFKTIYRRAPNMSQSNDNTAVTIMAYGLRPSQRNLNSEKTAINLFRKIFTYDPLNSTNWDAVRAIAYSGATR